jgi:queuine tRNA-ribosyltransferase
MQFELHSSAAKAGSKSPATGEARAGTITTGRGKIETPIFMPVGTLASVKTVPQDVLKSQIAPDIILANTYHLYLRPGMETMEAAGGVHKFMSWDGPMLTDSGGYQVYSMAENRKITEDGVTFRSHIDGSTHLFTPESAVDIQRTIGADIVMAFDECPPYPCDHTYAKQSMDMTHRWLDRCMAQMKATEPKYGVEQSLFPIVQGGTYKDLRREAAKQLAYRVADGNAIGGLSVGEPHDMMYESVGLVNEFLPKDKPRYLMGVGTPANILECIDLGVDMFDCVMPSRNARNGMLFTRRGTINMRNLKWVRDFSPIDPEGTADVDMRYSKAYLRHLFRSGELLGLHIATVHNLAFYLWLVREARRRIIDGTFSEWKAAIVPELTRRL